MEEYIFHHRNLFFRVFTDYDLQFDEVKALIDHLLQEGAFNEESDLFEEPKLYSIPYKGHLYDVDVTKYEIAIYKKTETCSL